MRVGHEIEILRTFSRINRSGAMRVAWILNLLCLWVAGGCARQQTVAIGHALVPSKTAQSYEPGSSPGASEQAARREFAEAGRVDLDAAEPFAMK